MLSIATDRVAWSVCLSVTLVSPVQTAEPIEMPFDLRTRMGPMNLRSTSPWEGAILRGKGRPIVKYRDTLRLSVQNG